MTPTSERPDHYFSATPASAEQIRAVDVRLAGRQVSLLVSAGVFSGGHLDAGTDVLLRTVAPLEVPPGAAVLDLGAGWGPIAVTMAMDANDRGTDATVWAVDVNQRALDLVRRNAERLGLDSIRAATPEQVPADIVFDAIWSNPPIRIGKEALHALLGTWLPRLAIGARAHLVVSKNLGSDSLHAWLESQLAVGPDGWPICGTVTRIASSRGFRVLEVTRTG